MWNTIVWVSNTRLILELISFIASPLLVIAGFFVLIQIRLSKNLSAMSSRRESFRLAAEQCRYFDAVIFPLYDKLNNRIKKEGILFFEKSSVEFNGNTIKILPCKDENEFKKLGLIVEDLSNLLNKIDAFAMYFTTRIADESIAYDTLGKDYCNIIKTWLPFILPNYEPPQHFIALFFKWNARLTLKEENKQKEKLKKQLNKIEYNEKELSELKKNIRPLGV